MNHSKLICVVVNNCQLGYLQPGSSYIGIWATSVLRGHNSTKSVPDPHYWTRSDTVRMATKKDFDEFRVTIHKNYIMMSFPEDTGMVGFNLPSFEEYCSDHDYPVDDFYRQDYEEYCQDLIEEMDQVYNADLVPDEDDPPYIGPKGSIDRTLNLADEAYERSIDA